MFKTTNLIPMFCLLSLCVPANGQDKITFDDHIKPLFQKRCASCHNGDKRSGGLDLTNFTNLMQGGSSGESIEAGDTSSSYLYSLVTHEDTPVMPPGGTKIPDTEISLLASWIDGGALENKGSVAIKKKVNVITSAVGIGARPAVISTPLRMSLEPHFRTEKPGLIRSIATSPWAPWVALAGPKQILLFETNSLEFAGAIPYPEGQANVLHFSINGSLLIAGGGRHGLSGHVSAFDVVQTNRIFDVGDEIDNVLASDIHPDQTLIALGGPQKMLRVYSTSDGSKTYEVKKHTDWITAIKFSPDGVLLATADRNGGLHLWEAETGNEYLTLGGHSAKIKDLSWRSDGNVLASCGEDGAIRLWEVENGRQIKSWNAHGQITSDVEFTRDGKIVSCGRDAKVKLWQQDGKLLRQFEGQKEMGIAVGFCDETQKIIASDFSGLVTVWNASESKLLKTLNTNPSTLAVRLAQSKQKLAEAESALQPIQAEYQSTENSLNQLAEQLSQQQNSLAAVNSEIQQIENQLAAENSRIDAKSKEQSTFEMELQEKEAHVPVLAEAVQSAAKASKLIPADEALKRSADTLTAKHKEYVDRVGQLTTSLDEIAATIAASQKTVSELQSKIGEIRSQLGATTKKIEVLKSQQQPLTKKKDELAPKLDEAKRLVAEFKLSTEKWNHEIEFHNLLMLKTDQLRKAETEVQKRSETMSQAQQELKAAESKFETRQNEHATAKKAVNDVVTEIQNLRSKK